MDCQPTICQGSPNWSPYRIWSPLPCLRKSRRPGQRPGSPTPFPHLPPPTDRAATLLTTAWNAASRAHGDIPHAVGTNLHVQRQMPGRSHHINWKIPYEVRSARNTALRTTPTRRWLPHLLGLPSLSRTKLQRTPSLKIRARCGNAARRDLCGGLWETRVPTATSQCNSRNIENLDDFLPPHQFENPLRRQFGSRQLAPPENPSLPTPPSKRSRKRLRSFDGHRHSFSQT